MTITKTIKTPRILALDIETKPITAYIWKLFDENIGVNQIVDTGGLLCLGAQWVGSTKRFFYSEWQHGKEEMLKAIHDLMSEADAIITFNGDRFDLRKLNGEFLKHRMPPLAPITSIDVYKTVKKMGLVSNKLAFVGPELNIGKKLDTHGFELWRLVMEGNEPARRRMQTYCLRDVKLLVNLYLRIKPYMIDHPHLADTKGQHCASCGSTHVHSRGYRRTRAFKIQRLQFQDCGAWSHGTRHKV